MPALSYAAITDYPFQPFTKIYSADINDMFAAISTLLNTTKLDNVNVQTHGLIRNGATSNLQAGTANFVVYNDSNGDLTEAAFLPMAKGGLGFDITPTGSIQAGQPLVVNSTGNGYVISPIGNTSSNIFNYFNLY